MRKKIYAKINSVDRSGPTPRMREMVGRVYKVRTVYPDGHVNIKGFMFNVDDIEYVEEKDYRLKFDPNNLMDV